MNKFFDKNLASSQRLTSGLHTKDGKSMCENQKRTKKCKAVWKENLKFKSHNMASDKSCAIF